MQRVWANSGLAPLRPTIDNIRFRIISMVPPMSTRGSPAMTTLSLLLAAVSSNCVPTSRKCQKLGKNAVYSSQSRMVCLPSQLSYQAKRGKRNGALQPRPKWNHAISCIYWVAKDQAQALMAQASPRGPEDERLTLSAPPESRCWWSATARLWMGPAWRSRGSSCAPSPPAAFTS